MGQQLKARAKRRRRANYLERKKTAAQVNSPKAPAKKAKPASKKKDAAAAE